MLSYIQVILIQVIILLSYFSTDRFHVIFSLLLLINIVILEQKHLPNVPPAQTGPDIRF